MFSGLLYLRQRDFTCNDSKTSKLKELDISNKGLELERLTFTQMIEIENLHTSDLVICCIFREQFPLSKANCFAPEDELSSCTDLLNSDPLRVFLWLQSLASLLGNGAVIIYRLFFEKRSSSLGFHVFVTSLSISDFMMGLYLLIIGSADLLYKGEFLWQRWDWKRQPVCTMAGVIGMVSSEVSAFTICLIMLDRLLAVKFPLHRQIHFSQKSATIATVLLWILGLAVAVTPLFPTFNHWEFYRQNGICLPLPITRQTFPGQQYAQSIFLILNF